MDRDLVASMADRLHDLDHHGPPGFVGATYYARFFEDFYEAKRQAQDPESLFSRIKIASAKPCSECLEDRMKGPVARFAKIAEDVHWHSNAYCPRKAYAMSMLCELTYLKVSHFDVEGSDRYDFIASETLDDMLATGSRISLSEVQRAAELHLEIVEREFFSYLITQWRGFAIVAVRGTSKASEWLTNLDVQRLREAGADYHPGFHQEALDGMFELRFKLPRNFDRTYFTGHSLGGAIAAILAQHRSEYVPYLFGSPRFGNQAAVDRGLVHAVVRRADLVPHLPPKGLGYAENSSAAVVLGAAEAAPVAQAIKEWLPSGKRFAVQHNIEGYRRRLGFELGEDFPDIAYQALRTDVIRTP
jgi:hypothetical protein